MNSTKFNGDYNEFSVVYSMHLLDIFEYICIVFSNEQKRVRKEAFFKMPDMEM